MAKLVSRLNYIADNSEKVISLALHETANQILTLIRLFAPVETGWLRDSYQKDSITPTHILIGTMVNYAVWQEYGTRFQSGTPHVLPAFALGKDIFIENLKQAMQELG